MGSLSQSLAAMKRWASVVAPRARPVDAVSSTRMTRRCPRIRALARAGIPLSTTNGDVRLDVLTRDGGAGSDYVDMQSVGLPPPDASAGLLARIAQGDREAFSR